MLSRLLSWIFEQVIDLEEVERVLAPIWAAWDADD